MALRLLLVRHAGSPVIDSRAPAPPDPELTREGRLALTTLGHLLGERPVDFAVTSPARRCRQTATMAGFAGLPVSAVLGPVQGARYADVLESAGAPGAARPALELAMAELDAWVETLSRNLRGTVLVFTHAEVIAHLIARWTPLDFAAAHRVSPASLSILEFGQQVRLMAFNAGAIGPALHG